MLLARVLLSLGASIASPRRPEKKIFIGYCPFFFPSLFQNQLCLEQEELIGGDERQVERNCQPARSSTQRAVAAEKRSKRIARLLVAATSVGADLGDTILRLATLHGVSNAG